MTCYYVYGLTDPRKNNQFFYIGKGKGKRWRKHLTETKCKTDNPRRFNCIEAIRNDGLTPGVIFIENNLEQSDALYLEETLIRKYGRMTYDPGGILTNICLGGIGNNQGKISITLEERVKTSLTMSQTYLEKTNVISQKDLTAYFETLRSYFFGVKNSKINKIENIGHVVDKIISQKQNEIQGNVKQLTKRPSLSREMKQLSLSQEEYRKLFTPTELAEKIPPPRLKERRYILINEDDHKIYKLGSRDLTAFCNSHGIIRNNLTAALRRGGRSYHGWKLEKEDCEQNRNNPPRILSEDERNALSTKLKGLKRTPEQKAHLKAAQQHTYSVIDPNGKNYVIKSTDIKSFCVTFGLCYGTLMDARKFNKPYRRWTITEILKDKETK